MFFYFFINGDKFLIDFLRKKFNYQLNFSGFYKFLGMMIFISPGNFWYYLGDIFSIFRVCDNYYPVKFGAKSLGLSLFLCGEYEKIPHFSTNPLKTMYPDDFD